MKKLQIILVGNEWDRLIYPIKEHNPDKVVLLCQDEPKFSEENEQLSKIADKEKLTDYITSVSVKM